ncbi:MAG: hypothetical protein IT428_04995 [Planctomycetaceae bacterium]|nr:hypothetical protein [Planctomycetaceae bacterium]
MNDLSNVRRMKEGTKATAAELREFLAGMRGRSPQEMLGAVAASSLVQCTVAATLITAAFFVVFTLGPYYLHGAPKPKEKPVAAAAPAAAPAEPAKTEAPSAAPAATNTADGKSNVEKAAEKMDLIETKPSDPKKNPLDKDLDNLLDVK